MAQTLLSGANIVYNGDPINDLSLNAFLDKFMEKKPNPNKKAEGRWLGGSRIAPARKLDTSHHLIGDEILQLAEEEVSPENVVFHRFYMNKTGSSKKEKKNKSLSHDEDVEEILPHASDASEGEMDNMLDSGSEDEIDNVLGSGSVTLEEYKGEYDYDDLDRVAAQDDDDLLGNDSDTETSSPSEPIVGSDNDDDGSLNILDADGEDSDDDDVRAMTAPDDDDDDDDDILDDIG